MDKDLADSRRRAVQDPQDRAAAEATARRHSRSLAPQERARRELLLAILEFLAARSPGEANAAGVADRLLEDLDRRTAEALRAQLSTLRPYLGEGRAPEGPVVGDFPLSVLDSDIEEEDAFREFFGYAQEFGSNAGGYAWRYRLLRLPVFPGHDLEAASRCLLELDESLARSHMPVVESVDAGVIAGARGALPDFPGFPRGLPAVLRALIAFRLGADWLAFDVPIRLRNATRSDLSFLAFEEAWYSLEQVFN